ncbi:MAG: Ig-like domain-containing protein, partial [Gemmatimonadetes bacterium]|nr:Ig-like domain-containing protein [Gemmatimonadota bacterium]
MNRPGFLAVVALTGVLWLLMTVSQADARNPIRSTFFTIYSSADNTQLDDLPSNTKHCGVCHFDFDGGGARNPYGLGIEVGLGGGLSTTDAILAIDGQDSDGDGYANNVEVLSTLFTNTPTFPGLHDGNKTNTSNIPLGEIEPFLTPAGGNDSTPPAVTVLSPNGGGSHAAGGFTTVSFTATDASGILYVDFYFSDDGGSSFKLVGQSEPYNAGSFSWFVPNRPGSANRLKVVAVDSVGNAGEDDSDNDFTITGQPAGIVPTTLRDMDLAGTQPFEGAVLSDPEDCMTCHGGYDDAVEPWHNWYGSMMGQAMRDPLFLACLAVAEQDAPSVGDLCIRCHTPGGWQEGRSVDTSGDLLTDKDKHGIQ